MQRRIDRAGSRIAAASVAMACLALGVAAGPGRGQIPDPDPLAVGLGGASTAISSRLSAPSTNPAVLGVVGESEPWIVVLSVLGRQGLDPIGLDDVGAWDGRDVPRSVREAWADRVDREGSEIGAVGVDVTLVAATWRRFAIQLSGRAAGIADLNPDAVEILLFGNAGRNGVPRDFALQGSRGDAYAMTTLALAYGLPAGSLFGGAVHLGATVKGTAGHAVAVAADNGSALGGDPLELELRLPILYSESVADHGGGFGLDLGAQWSRERWDVGIHLENVVQTFEWWVDGLVFRPGAALFDAESSESDFDPRPGVGAPPLLLDELEELVPRPAVSLGIARRHSPELVLTAEVRSRFGAGLGAEPEDLAGVGAAYTPSPRFPLRAGLAVYSGGVQLTGAAGARFGDFVVALGGAARRGGLHDGVSGWIGFALGG